MSFLPTHNLKKKRFVCRDSETPMEPAFRNSGGAPVKCCVPVVSWVSACLSDYCPTPGLARNLGWNSLKMRGLQQAEGLGQVSTCLVTCCQTQLCLIPVLKSNLCWNGIHILAWKYPTVAQVVSHSKVNNSNLLKLTFEWLLVVDKWKLTATQLPDNSWKPTVQWTAKSLKPEVNSRQLTAHSEQTKVLTANSGQLTVDNQQLTADS